MKAAVQRAVRRSKSFWGFTPRKIDRIRLTWPGALVNLGRCSQVNYVSDKYDGELREYFHKFEGNVEIFAADSAQADGREIIVIIGKFKIKPEGIVG